MWVFTVDGFYSAVQHKRDPDTMIVRCRDEGDALSLQGRLESYGFTWPVLSTPTADYAYRLLVPKETWARYLSDTVERVDYSNFKDTVLVRQGRDRAHLYGEVWATMLDLQDGN